MIKKTIGFFVAFVSIFVLSQILFGERKEERDRYRYGSNTKGSYENGDVQTSLSRIERLLMEYQERLNDRQIAIMQLFSGRDILLPSEIYALHPNVSTRTLRRDMTLLVDLGLVIQEGSTRDTRYLLKDRI
jgi:hypothetical protein